MCTFLWWVSWFERLIMEFILILYNYLFWCLLSWDWRVLLIHLSIRVEEVLSLGLLREWFFLYFSQVIFTLLFSQFLLCVVVILHIWDISTKTRSWTGFAHLYWVCINVSWTNNDSVIISGLSSFCWRIWHILISCRTQTLLRNSLWMLCWNESLIMTSFYVSIFHCRSKSHFCYLLKRIACGSI